jgi:hypothetical protein
MLGRIYARIDPVLVRLTTGVVSILAMTDRTSIGLRGGLASRHSPRCRLISVRRVSNVHHGGEALREKASLLSKLELYVRGGSSPQQTR